MPLIPKEPKTLVIISSKSILQHTQHGLEFSKLTRIEVWPSFDALMEGEKKRKTRPCASMDQIGIRPEHRATPSKMHTCIEFKRGKKHL